MERIDTQRLYLRELQREDAVRMSEYRNKKEVAFYQSWWRYPYKKAVKLLEELQEHPQTGTGKPEQLKGDRAGQWSRRITDRHRLVYEIEEEQVMVLILSSYGHYDDK